MYIPAAFREDDPAKLAAFMRRHSFATLVTHDGVSSFASHVPVLLESGAGPHGTLVAHLARANPQWQHFARGEEVLVIFHGPHAYISPTWYETEPAVPTWNYAAVHAYGVPRLIEDHERLKDLLRETISMFEAAQPEPWSGDLPEEYRDKMMKAIVGFEIPLTRVEGKFKLGQNRAPADVQGVYRALSTSGDPGDRALAELMRAEGRVPSP